MRQQGVDISQVLAVDVAVGVAVLGELGFSRGIRLQGQAQEGGAPAAKAMGGQGGVCVQGCVYVVVEVRGVVIGFWEWEALGVGSGGQ
jgi:hypothetical protein